MVKKKGAPEDFGIPVWTDLPARWYQQLNRLAKKHGLTRKTILLESLKMYSRTLQERKSPFRKVDASPGDEKKARQVFGKFAKTWWDSLTEEERKQQGEKRRQAALKRWKDEKRPKQ